MCLGLVYIGCNLVPSRNTTLKLLETNTTELSDDRLNHTKPVAKCGLAAIKQGYEYFGVSGGYCISGSNNSEHYNTNSSYYSGWCNDGIGRVYYTGRYTYYFMDVYKVTDVSSFTVSADSAIGPDSATTVSPSSATIVLPSPTLVCEPSGVGVHGSSLLLLSLSLITVLVTMLH